MCCSVLQCVLQCDAVTDLGAEKAANRISNKMVTLQHIATELQCVLQEAANRIE